MINNSPFAQVIENMKKNGATDEEVNHVQNALDNSEEEMQQKKEACNENPNTYWDDRTLECIEIDPNMKRMNIHQPGSTRVEYDLTQYESPGFYGADYEDSTITGLTKEEISALPDEQKYTYTNDFHFIDGDNEVNNTDNDKHDFGQNSPNHKKNVPFKQRNESNKI